MSRISSTALEIKTDIKTSLCLFFFLCLSVSLAVAGAVAANMGRSRIGPARRGRGRHGFSVQVLGFWAFGLRGAGPSDVPG